MEQLTGFRLSPQQKSLWLLNGGSTCYKALCAIRIEGDLDPSALRDSIQQVVNRQAILRTTFQSMPGLRTPIQVIADQAGFTYDRLDLSQASFSQQEELIEQVWRQMAIHEVNLEAGPVLRVLLASLGEQRHMLILGLPSLCADIRTLANLQQQIIDYLSEQPANILVDDEPLQYSQFSEWQYELLEDEDGKPGRDYWSELRRLNLQGVVLGLERKAAGDRFLPEVFCSQIGSELAADVRQVARRYEVSVSGLLLACWQTLLWRLTDQPYIVVADHFDGRKYGELQDGLGLFAKHLPVGARFERGLRFADLLRQVEQSRLKGQQWADQFVAESDAPVIASIGFELHKWPAVRVNDKLAFSTYRLYSCLGQFKIRLCCFESTNSIKAEFHYDTRSFSVSDIEQIADQFMALLRSALTRPEACVEELELLSSRESNRLLVELNSTFTPYPPDEFADRLFEQQVERTPLNIAVSAVDQKFSYKELNAAANRLAHYLVKRGVGPDVPVGICLERGSDLVIAILGVLKSGGAYVPVDPNYPKYRQSYMLEDSRAALLITRLSLIAELEIDPCRIICLNEEQEALEKESDENPASRIAAENLAYVIYTSGSTGQPKGVGITHRGFANYLQWSRKAYITDGLDGAPVHSSIGFDLTVTSLFCPLLSGQRVDLLSEEEGIEALSAAMRSSRYSLVKITPSYLELLNQWLTQQEASGSAGALVIGGEALYGDTLMFWRADAPDTRIINEYGPTETVVGSITYEMRRGEETTGALPIGRPIANTQVYILDADSRPVPVGVKGELYIGGAGLARCYLNRPDLTAERFVPNPFSTGAGERLYKTGDLARYRADGIIEYLGRNDEQVKIRGYRVELGEVEAVLRSHTGVEEALAVAREENRADKRLVAYLVAKQGVSLNVDELRRHMGKQLPEYMIPFVFITLDKMPLNVHGKVDRKALPSPGHARPELERAYVPPGTPIEHVLAAIWIEVLGISKIGIHDSFFALGGDSIRSVRVVALAKERGLNFTVQNLFQYQTISELAREIERAAGLDAPADEIVSQGEEDIARLLDNLEALSEEEVNAMLREKMQATDLRS